MATERALAIKSERAMKRIETSIASLGVEVSFPLAHRDKEVLRSKQLTAIADALEQVSNADVTADDTLSEARALVASGQWTKDQLTRLLLGEA